jgi:uncharacterized protein YrrD
MLIKAKTLKGYQLESLDGDIGKVKEFYFDDRHWAVRYLVAETGSWLMDRSVLISPYALGAVNEDQYTIVVSLTKKQIENSPLSKSDQPVSRQFEDSYNSYYGWPSYWSGVGMWGASPVIPRNREIAMGSEYVEKPLDLHLRSTHDVTNHRIQATDDEIGHVEDFIIDDETWAIRYLIINTRNWWPGKKVLISPGWIDSVSWSESKVFVNVSRESIKTSPDYTDELLPTRDYEDLLHRHYKRQVYWVDEVAATEHSR